MPPRWLVQVVEEVRRCGRTRAVDFTVKADEELLAVDLGLAEEDACDVLARLSARDFAKRLISRLSGEPMYVFEPMALRRSSRGSHRRGRSLPDDACPRCGAAMRPVERRLKIRINGEPVTVDAVPHRRCPRCGEAVLSYEETVSFNRRALEAYRRKHRLLSEREIREIRERLGLTQAALARLLRLGSNTVSRWEAGRNVQSASMDMMLRLLRDVPGALAYLRRRAA